MTDSEKLREIASDLEDERYFITAEELRRIADRIEQGEWIPIKSSDELPDGRLWVTFDNAEVTYVNGRIFKSILKEYPPNIEKKVIAFKPYNHPEPYQPPKTK